MALDSGRDLLSGEMAGFQVVFRIRVRRDGTLVFWDDDGSILRRDGEIVHLDRTMHPLTRSELAVRAGDLLEVAQWQAAGEWLWGARLENPEDAATGVEALLPFLEAVEWRLRRPTGPPLKMFCGGDFPLRTALAVYSFILNGASPGEVVLFGEHQWSETSRALLRQLLPFARIVPTADVLREVETLGQPGLAAMARGHWFVLKTVVSLLYPPFEHGMIDDDVVMLEPVADALAAFDRADLVFARDVDYSQLYRETWRLAPGSREPLRTGSFNAGLYWVRVVEDRATLARAMLRAAPDPAHALNWEQGFIATRYESGRIESLPPERYFYPFRHGLPGGILGYDYALNPCGFTSVHFGGLAEKPADWQAALLAPRILGRRASPG